MVTRIRGKKKCNGVEEYKRDEKIQEGKILRGDIKGRIVLVVNHPVPTPG